MQESQQAQGLMGVIFVPQGEQQESCYKREQALTRLENRNTPQSQVLDQNALSFIHEGLGNTYKSDLVSIVKKS